MNKPQIITTPDQLDLNDPKQKIITDTLSERYTIENGILNILGVIHEATNILTDAPLQAYQRVAYELDAKAKQTGDPKDLYAAQTVWAFTKLVQEMSALSSPAWDNKPEGSSESPVEGGDPGTDEYGATKGCDCPACRLVRSLVKMGFVPAKQVKESRTEAPEEILGSQSEAALNS